MQTRLLTVLVLAYSLATSVRAVVVETVCLSLRDGGRIVLLADTFIEREGQRGFIEAALVAARPEARNTSLARYAAVIRDVAAAYQLLGLPGPARVRCRVCGFRLGGSRHQSAT